MYDVVRKPTKMHVFAQHICRVFSVCQDPLRVYTGMVRPTRASLQRVLEAILVRKKRSNPV